MAIDRLHQVPIPDRNRYPITINRGDHNKVLYVLDAPFDRQKGFAVPQRTVIGYVCPDDQSKMYPTDKYKIIFSRDWERQTGKKVKPMVKKVGLFCAFRAIDKKINLFKYIHEAFGMDTGNRILDFVLYSILFKSASFAEMQQVISDQMLFSSGVRSDSFYSGLFKSSIPENSILNFKKMWAQHCRRLGVEEVWLCIDGSNDDCESKGVELAEKGYAKSHRNSNIVSFSYAVTSSGMPVTFNVYRGGLVDAKGMELGNGLGTVGLDLVVDNDMARIFTINSYVDDGTYMMAIVPFRTNGIHHLRVTHTDDLIPYPGADAMTCNLLDITDDATVCSLIRESVTQGCADGMGREVFDVGSEM